MRKGIIVLHTICLVVALCISHAYSQQDLQFTQYRSILLPFNPGSAGLGSGICATAIYRSQWTGFTDIDENGSKTKTNPQDIVFAIEAPVNMLHGGVGLTIFSDKLGYENNTSLKLAYSFHLDLGQGTLGLGINLGLLNKKIDFSKLRAIDPNDALIQGKGDEGDMMFDMSFGAFYRVPEKYYAGIGVTQLVPSEGSKTDVELRQHIYLTGGFEYMLPNPDWILEPSAMIKTDLTSSQYDLTVTGKWRNQYWGGLSYRVQDAFSILLGGRPFTSGKLRDLSIGYSYDFTTSDLRGSNRSSGSHEIAINYCFRIEKAHTEYKYMNTRYLGNF